MKCKMVGALIASLGVAAFALVPNETFARSGGARGGAIASPHSIARAPGALAFRHGRRNHVGAFWPAVVGDSYYGPSGGEPVAEAAPAQSNDVRYTYTYDVPWDWAHRYPPSVAPSDRPYVSGCPTEIVKVPGRGGGEQTVNVTRCY